MPALGGSVTLVSTGGGVVVHAASAAANETATVVWRSQRCTGENPSLEFPNVLEPPRPLNRAWRPVQTLTGLAGNDRIMGLE
jgi:hypothetical protein